MKVRVEFRALNVTDDLCALNLSLHADRNISSSFANRRPSGVAGCFDIRDKQSQWQILRV